MSVEPTPRERDASVNRRLNAIVDRTPRPSPSPAPHSTSPRSVSMSPGCRCSRASPERRSVVRTHGGASPQMVGFGTLNLDAEPAD